MPKITKLAESMVFEEIENALFTYSSSGHYAEINRQLRSGNLTAPIKKLVKWIDAGMTPSNSAFQVYRAASIPEVTALIKEKKKLEGLIFKDNAYFSTTKNKQKLTFFASSHLQQHGTPNFFIINVSVGTMMIDMNDFSQFGKNEEEILLSRGLKYKIVSTEDVKEKQQIRNPFTNKIGSKTIKRQFIVLDIVK